MFYSKHLGGDSLFKFEIVDSELTKKRIALKGESIRSFATFVGVSPSMLSQVLNGKRKASAVIAGKIAKGLNKEVKEIFLIIEFTGKQDVV